MTVDNNTPSLSPRVRSFALTVGAVFDAGAAPEVVSVKLSHAEVNVPSDTRIQSVSVPLAVPPTMFSVLNCASVSEWPCCVASLVPFSSK